MNSFLNYSYERADICCGNDIYPAFAMMPMFRRGNFNKKSHRRKIEKGKNDGEVRYDDDEVISVRLGDVEKVFSNGKWVSRWNSKREVSDERTTMARCLNELEERNNLLKLKYEILMDMVIALIYNFEDLRKLFADHFLIWRELSFYYRKIFRSITLNITLNPSE